MVLFISRKLYSVCLSVFGACVCVKKSEVRWGGGGLRHKGVVIRWHRRRPAADNCRPRGLSVAEAHGSRSLRRGAFRKSRRARGGGDGYVERRAF